MQVRGLSPHSLNLPGGLALCHCELREPGRHSFHLPVRCLSLLQSQYVDINSGFLVFQRLRGTLLREEI
jgi:hypothetical protein